MLRRFYFSALFFSLVIGLWNSDAILNAVSSGEKQKSFRDYWYQGKAELTRYDLKQSRYGEIHSGEAVFIFVTEPFLAEKQVKYEHGDRSGAISVLKGNLTRKFFTGIYPYSIMTSVFTPVDLKNRTTLKTTTSVQEWCGHTFTQLNWRNGKYAGLLYSYFQDEGDQRFEMDGVMLEDEIWTRIRISPATLPQGSFRIIPGGEYSRLRHFKLQPVAATATLSAQGDHQLYTVHYPDLNRDLKIEFESALPHAIVSWEEKGPGGFGPTPKILTTKAVRTKSIWLDYWNKHSVSDSGYRKELGLTQN